MIIKSIENIIDIKKSHTVRYFFKPYEMLTFNLNPYLGHIRLVKLHLVDLNVELVECWQTAFAESSEVEILCADMLEVAHTCVVSPSNSYGFMDGGIDYVYYNYFGADIQVKVQEAIARRPEGMLPVGASLLVLTGDAKIPFLLVAPTMEMPGAVGFSHCYHAMVAILRSAYSSHKNISDIFCPGLATGVGRVAPEYAAEEMAAAYHDWNVRMQKKNEKREAL